MSIPRQLGDFASARQKTLSKVSSLTQAQLDFQPAAGKWSVGEVLDHLPKVDAIYRDEIAELVRRAKAGERPFLRRSFQDIDVSVMFLPKVMLPLFEIPFTLGSKLLPRAVAGAMASSRWLPIHAPDRTLPRKGRPMGDLVTDLRSSVADFETLFAEHAGLDFDRMIHQHPLFGVNTVPQMLEVLLLHERRHQAQIGDLLTHRAFPAAKQRGRTQ